MSLTTTVINPQSTQVANTFEEAKSHQSQKVWQQLEQISVQQAAELWLATLHHRTRINYQSGLRRLAEKGLLSPLLNLQTFALVNPRSYHRSDQISR
jgi:hypothetical protein